MNKDKISRMFNNNFEHLINSLQRRVDRKTVALHTDFSPPSPDKLNFSYENKNFLGRPLPGQSFNRRRLIIVTEYDFFVFYFYSLIASEVEKDFIVEKCDSLRNHQ